MTRPINFVVSKSREGWAVSVESDRLSEHRRVEEARDAAAMLTDDARRDGVRARLVDLSAGDDD